MKRSFRATIFTKLRVYVDLTADWDGKLRANVDLTGLSVLH